MSTKSAKQILAVLIVVSASFILIACGAAVETATRGIPVVQVRTPESRTPEGDQQIITWYRDDYAAARGQALELNVPIVIDMWAQWCHSCLSMTHFVLNDPGMSAYRDRFVWLAVDTDRESNEDLLEKYTVSSWPTFMVIDPHTETIVATQVGTATVEEFSDFLIRGETAYLSKNDPDDAVWRASAQAGDAAYIRRDFITAARHYNEALAGLPSDHGSRLNIVLSLTRSLARSEQWRECAEVATREWPSIGVGGATESFAFWTHYCATHLPDDDAQRKLIDERAIALLEQLLASPPRSMPVDDRASAMATLRVLLDAQGSHDAARAVARQQKSILDQAAAEAQDPYVASIFNYPRYEVYSYLGVPGELIDDLKLQVEALPEQYDPPYRLAQVYLETEDYENALVYARRAAELSYGPRQCRIYTLIAGIHSAAGDRTKEANARKEVIEICEALPAAQKDYRVEKIIANQRELLSSLPAAAP